MEETKLIEQNISNMFCSVCLTNLMEHNYEEWNEHQTRYETLICDTTDTEKINNVVIKYETIYDKDVFPFLLKSAFLIAFFVESYERHRNVGSYQLQILVSQLVITQSQNTLQIDVFINLVCDFLNCFYNFKESSFHIKFIKVNLKKHLILRLNCLRICDNLEDKILFEYKYENFVNDCKCNI